MAYNNLWDFYNSQGKALPSVTERSKLYEQAGLGSASSYTGLANQNTSLLGYLQKPATPSYSNVPAGSNASMNPNYVAPTVAPVGSSTVPSTQVPSVVNNQSSAIQQLSQPANLGSNLTSATQAPQIQDPQYDAKMAAYVAEQNRQASIKSQAQNLVGTGAGSTDISKFIQSLNPNDQSLTQGIINPASYQGVQDKNSIGSYKGKPIYAGSDTDIQSQIAQIDAGPAIPQNGGVTNPGADLTQLGKSANVDPLGNKAEASGTNLAQNQMDQLSTFLEKLGVLKSSSVNSGADAATIAKLDQQIAQAQSDLEDLSYMTPQNYLTSEPGLRDVGIEQNALERRTAIAKYEAMEPVTRSLSKLLTSRSYFLQAEAQQQASEDRRLNQMTQGLQLYQAMQAMSQPKEEEILSTNYDDISGMYNQLYKDPSGQIKTRSVGVPEIKGGLNQKEYAAVLSLATNYPDAGINIGSIEETDTIMDANKKVAKSASFLSTIQGKETGGLAPIDVAKLQLDYGMKFGNEPVAAQFSIGQEAYKRLRTAAPTSDLATATKLSTNDSALRTIAFAVAALQNPASSRVNPIDGSIELQDQSAAGQAEALVKKWSENRKAAPTEILDLMLEGDKLYAGLVKGLESSKQDYKQFVNSATGGLVSNIPLPAYIDENLKATLNSQPPKTATTRIKNIKTGQLGTYNGTLTAAEAKAKGYEIIK